MLNRRDAMLRLGQFGFGGLTLPTLLQAERLQASTATPAKTGGKAKSCILLYLWGGPSQHDTFDMKPDQPDGIRSIFKPMDTVTPGIRICDQLPQIAKHTDKMAIVRSLTHKSNDHIPSVFYTLTGRIDPTLAGSPRQRRRTDFPCIGSVVSHLTPMGVLPNTVTIPRPIGHDGVTYAGTYAGFLGPKDDPLELKAPGEVNAPPPHSMEMPEGLSSSRLQARYDLLKAIENHDRQLQRGKIAGLDVFREQAFRMLTSPEAKGAFDLERETATMRDRYGRNEYGECFLTARRLVESGVRLVTVVWYYVCPDGNVANVWDNHGGIPSLNKIGGYDMLKADYCFPSLDRAYSALLEDLSARGLLDDTLVAMYGEFGRTPKINPNAGREHWGACQSAVFAGGGIRGGQIYGSSDIRAEYPKDHPVSPADMVATIYHAMNISPDAEILDKQKRPWRLSEGTPLTGLF